VASFLRCPAIRADIRLQFFERALASPPELHG
jgi:hypothetical protein